MGDADIKVLREKLANIKNKINDTSDKGIAGQYNTFQYVAKSQHTRAWAQGTPVGSKLASDLEKESQQLREFMNMTLEFVNIVEDLIDKQGSINMGYGINN